MRLAFPSSSTPVSAKSTCFGFIAKARYISPCWWDMRRQVKCSSRICCFWIRFLLTTCGGIMLLCCFCHRRYSALGRFMPRCLNSGRLTLPPKSTRLSTNRRWRTWCWEESCFSLWFGSRNRGECAIRCFTGWKVGRLRQKGVFIHRLQPRWSLDPKAGWFLFKL